MNDFDRKLTPLILLVLFAVGFSNLWVGLQPLNRVAIHCALISALVLFCAAGAVAYLGNFTFGGLLSAFALLFIGASILPFKLHRERQRRRKQP